ncbi:hypothetical protein EKI60_04465 [Candidatus Saccharibacteria bacterium]|nr:MAG: hypothetical protein EKI60_04465 [Candidatus Saccharibacteria bacterium]
MEIQYYGGNCLKISTKKATIVVDDNIKALGGSDIAKPGDVVLYTGASGKPKDPKFLIARPGDYEVADVAITGVASRSHLDEEGKESATMYRIVADDVRIAVVGHIHPDLGESELEALGTIDILIIPVGGHGFTLDPVGALKVIKEIEPKLIIPTQYDDKKLTYEVPAVSLEEALKGLAMEPKETVGKLKIKGSEFVADQAQLIVLECQ